MIEVKNLSMVFKTYSDRISTLKEYVIKKLSRKIKANKHVVLNNISFKINDNEIVGIIGDNGSGKSTLLKLISGILYPTSGSIKVTNKLVIPLLELGAGFDDDLDAKENIYLNGALLGLSKKYIDEKFNEIIEFSELKDYIGTKLRNYSTGMRMRLAFSIATIINPELILIDEILAVGDQNFQEKSYNKMIQLMNNNVTIVIVSHDLARIKEICTRVIWLDEGVIKADGNPGEVCNAYIKKCEERKQNSGIV